MIDRHDEFLTRRHFGSLDGLRCLAILPVLWHHSGLEGYHPALNRGFLGVDLFFVLSGFLIVTLLLREKAANGIVSLKKFYMRRMLRIFPPYFGLLAALTLMYLAIPGLNTASDFWHCLPWYITCTSNWSVAQAANLGIMWSLATEEQFYLIWPAVERFFRYRFILLTLAALLAVNQCIAFDLLDGVFAWLYGMDSAPSLNILDVTFFPIAMGVVVAHVLNHKQGFSRVNALLAHFHIPTLLFIALLALIAFLPADLSGWPRLVIHLTMATWLSSLVVQENHGMHRLLGAKPIAFVGTISFGVYLYHMWVFHVVDALGSRAGLESGIGLFVLKVLATIGVAAMSFYFFEKPCLRLKDRYSVSMPSMTGR